MNKYTSYKLTNIILDIISWKNDNKSEVKIIGDLFSVIDNEIISFDAAYRVNYKGVLTNTSKLEVLQYPVLYNITNKTFDECYQVLQENNTYLSNRMLLQDKFVELHPYLTKMQAPSDYKEKTISIFTKNNFKKGISRTNINNMSAVSFFVSDANHNYDDKEIDLFQL